MNVEGDKKKIPRPMNAFMLFANDNRAEFRRNHPGETNSKISVRLGAAWKALNGKDKTKYYQLSKQAEVDHRNKYPGYTYCPNEARSSKRARRQRRARKVDKLADTIPASSSPPQSSSSNESCTDIQKNRLALNDYRETKPEHRIQGFAYPGQYRGGDVWHCGQGDQMPPYPMPYGPQYLPPMGYPRYPCWDFRPHPYMSPQYGRMPFMSHPMMYQCPPLHPQQMGFGMPMTEPKAESNELFNSSVSSSHPTTETCPEKGKTVDATETKVSSAPSSNFKKESGKQPKESQPKDIDKKPIRVSGLVPLLIQNPTPSASHQQPCTTVLAKTRAIRPKPEIQVNNNTAGVIIKSEPSSSQPCSQLIGLPASGWANEIPLYTMPSTKSREYATQIGSKTTERKAVSLLKLSDQSSAQNQTSQASASSHQQPTYSIPLTNIRIVSTTSDNKSGERQPKVPVQSQNPSLGMPGAVNQPPYQVDIQLCPPPYSLKSASQEPGSYSLAPAPQNPNSYSYRPFTEHLQYLPTGMKTATVKQPKTYTDLSSAEVKIVTIPTN